jgi:phosphoenolpyruvate-protein phosphotransferase/dihydroxyacetone kinase phosphotransfer subunit
VVSLVLVSHSRKLALAVRDLVRQMAGSELTIAIASGVGERHQELGTDAVYIAKTLKKACGPDGALVLMDLGSAVLSTETALELIDPGLHERVRLCAGPLVEGALAAAVLAAANSSLDDVFQEAQRALAAKEEQLGGNSLPSQRPIATPSSDADELVLRINNEHGLHARPAANLIRTLGKYKADIQITNETSGRGPASARSMTCLALLQVSKGDQIRVRATGVDRAAALSEISELAAKGFGEAPAETVAIRAIVKGRDERGIPASEGIAIGPLVALRDLSISIPQDLTDNPSGEIDKVTSAIARVRAVIASEPPASREAKDILDAQELILEDPVLAEKVKGLVETNRWNAALAWMTATSELNDLYQKMDDSYLRARAADIRDIGRRVLRELSGEVAPTIRLERPSILFGDELLASDAVACDSTLVLGVITRDGSPTAHGSILLRTHGIPMIVGVDWLDGKSIEGVTAAMDGGTGEVWLDPDPEILARLSAKKNERQAQQEEAAKSRTLPSLTLDDVRIEVLANVGNVHDAETAAQNGAEGIGLLRSEFLFLSRADAPSEKEQEQALREIFSAIMGTMIVRTLDIGADKPLAFQPQRRENNPFLGVRGIRSSLRNPDFFSAHLRAILAAAAGRDVWLMLPMVSVVDEIHQTRALLETAHDKLEADGRDHLWPVKLGVMIEVPSAALMAEQLAEEAEFFSIGTNDLTQYVMAAERGNGALGNLQDALQPAVLRLMKKVANSAAITARHVSICGDAASDPVAAAVFAGLGIRSLSVRPKQTAEIKALFRQLKYSELTSLAHDALQCVDADHVRAICRECFTKNALIPTL